MLYSQAAPSTSATDYKKSVRTSTSVLTSSRNFSRSSVVSDPNSAIDMEVLDSKDKSKPDVVVEAQDEEDILIPETENITKTFI